MKKKLFAIIMSAMMVTAFMPMLAFADSTTNYVTGKTIQELAESHEAFILAMGDKAIDSNDLSVKTLATSKDGSLVDCKVSPWYLFPGTKASTYKLCNSDDKNNTKILKISDYRPGSDYSFELQGPGATSADLGSEWKIVDGKLQAANRNNVFLNVSSTGFEAVSSAEEAGEVVSYEKQPEGVKIAQELKLSASVFTYDGKAKAPTVTTLAGTPSSAIHVQKATKPGTYKVSVDETDLYTAASATFSVKVKAATFKSLKKGKKSFTVKVKKLGKSYVTGYQVRYSTKKSMKSAKVKTIGNKYNKVSKKVTKLKAKKTYYVQVRSYKTISGKKYCSSWSAAKKVKTK